MKLKLIENSTFLISGKNAKVIINPTVSLKDNADIVIYSNEKRERLKNVDGVKEIFEPGEFEFLDVFIYGFKSEIDKGKVDQADIFLIDIENIQIGFIDDEVEKIAESVIDKMGIVNILLVPLKKDAGIKLSKIRDLILNIDPQIVIPMNTDKELMSEFKKIMGISVTEKMNELDIKKDEIPTEEFVMRVIELEKKTEMEAKVSDNN